MSYNLVSQYGALPILGWLWHLPVWGVSIVAVLIDFGVILLLMCFENWRCRPPSRRRWFMTFAVNDTLVIPLWLALGAYLMGRNPNPRGWYTATWFHWLALACGWLASLGLEVGAVRGGYFSKAQELSPSKLWHTIIFGVMGYYMSTSLVAGLAANITWMGNAALIGLVVVWVGVIIWDGQLFAVKPPDCVHPEWSWRTCRPNWNRC